MNTQSRLSSHLEHMDAGIFQVGPNATLSADGLMVNGQRSELRHIEDLKAFVFSTSTAIAGVLETLFPQVRAVPDLYGIAQPSTRRAWQDYNLHALRLAGGKGNPIVHGRAILQWCLAANCVATITGHEIAKTPGFLPVAFLLKQGGQALSTSVEDWQRYVHWKLTAFNAGLAGQDSPLNPRPEAITVIIPWPEELGADMGGPTKMFTNAYRIVRDIHVKVVASSVMTTLSAFGHLVRFDDASRLVESYDSQATSDSVEHLALEVDGQRFRASRDIWESSVQGLTRQYCFRLLG